MALRGTLANFGIAEILQLIHTQSKTGVLEARRDDGEKMEIFFSSGRVIRCDDGAGTLQRMEELLLAAEQISKDQLKKARKAQRNTDRTVGQLLVEQGAIDPGALADFVALQVRETIYQIFEWTGGSYSFEAKPPNFAKAAMEPIPSDTLIMEGFRRKDEWPLVRARVSNYNVVYQRLKEIEEVESEAEALERILDDAFSEFLDEPADDAPAKKKATGAASNLGRMERLVFSLVDGQRTVHELIALSRLGQFDTCKALVTLLTEGFVGPLKTKRAKKRPGESGGRVWRRLLGRLAASGLLVAAVAAALYLMPRSRAQLQQDARQVVSDALGRLRANRIQVVASALEVYRAEEGSYPDGLNVLVERGLIQPYVLEVPGQGQLEYLGIGTDYDLR